MSGSMLHAAHEVVRLMGDRAMRHFRSRVTVDLKEDGSEVTVVDRECEQLARTWIAERFPGDGILGEEFGSDDGATHRRWLIDPIDGTRSYVRGVPLWGSMIAVEEDGVVLAGGIFCPATGDLIVAAPGEGCWHNDSRTQVSPVRDPAQAVVLVTDPRFPSHPERAARWAALGGEVAVSRTWGDCYGYVMLVTGRAELMADDRLSPWDAAPLVPIVTEAGGVFTDWEGRPGVGRDGIATNAGLSTVLRQRLGIPTAELPPPSSETDV